MIYPDSWLQVQRDVITVGQVAGPNVTREWPAAIRLTRDLRKHEFSMNQIARILMNAKFKTKRGITVWNVGTIWQILHGKLKA